MGARRLHMCQSVRGVLRKNRAELKKMCAYIRKGDGNRFTPDELWNFFADHLSQGHEVLPLSAECEGFDFKTGCPGHEVPDAGDEQESQPGGEN